MVGVVGSNRADTENSDVSNPVTIVPFLVCIIDEI